MVVSAVQIYDHILGARQKLNLHSLRTRPPRGDGRTPLKDAIFSQYKNG